MHISTYAILMHVDVYCVIYTAESYLILPVAVVRLVFRCGLQAARDERDEQGARGVVSPGRACYREANLAFECG